jgi:UbiD family decarboxylase
MMDFSLQATCGYNNKVVTVEQNGVEYLGDVAEIVYTFLHAAGYSYVKQVIFVKDDGDEISTL